jgi:hypothetical protein
MGQLPQMLMVLKYIHTECFKYCLACSELLQEPVCTWCVAAWASGLLTTPCVLVWQLACYLLS